ncbi:hypothetical protein BDB00DRAFT_880051 [Zychaea mexicana]|uniref:uncharacterized protein n=1 Tax=Zychaea mexicana TaxID=64656 RepID=UPI0022FE0107|nr:uncharacterized protein BDB00DRAFT_880051 [Zychaea mexicana]KAI9471371.1 hypothetical protein BDB00DRAFT_880051 [Zychaea mexicana]
MKDGFTRWIDGDKKHTIALLSKADGTCEWSTDIGWQLYQQNQKKVDGGQKCVECKGDMQHIACDVQVNFKFIRWVGTARHYDTQSHGQYEAAHISKQSVAKLTERVALVVGSSSQRAMNPPQQPVREIDVDLQHARKMAYRRRNILALNGSNAKGAPNIETAAAPIRQLNIDFPGFVREDLQVTG